jgi:3-methyladenine DNA glycosylase AlkD
MLHSITHSIIESFSENSNPKYAKQMEAYMKNKFTFLGINAPTRTQLLKQISTEFKKLSFESKMRILDELWSNKEREYHLAMLELSAHMKSLFNVKHMSWLENKVTSNSWWDSVDFIAPHLIGSVLLKHPDQQEAYAYKWMESDNLWLNRTAIIFQLKYKTKTNQNLLSEMILSKCESKEFFIRKAAGWALREYGKVNPVWVSDFINSYRDILSPLTVKEGGRRLFLNKK